MGFTLKSGEFFESNIQRRAENLTRDFEIHDGVVIPAGEYWFTRYELQFETFDGRPVYGFFFINWGDFYNGKRTEWFIRSAVKMNKHLNLSFDYTQNIIKLPEGDFTVNELGSRLEFAVSPDLFGSVFGQWNSDENEVLLNFRVNWIPKIGTNFFFVVNQVLDTHGHSWHLTDTSVLSKLVWRFVL